MSHQHQKQPMTLRGNLDHRAHRPQRISPASYERYTVAWICALPKEKTAAQAVLDEVHEPLPRKKNDSNSYVLGSIGCHNIVIACLPTNEYGTNNAVNVLTNLTRTFESIYISLMVGIGGGVPRENFDIRLGDVIVGTRVVQHDLGKIVGSGQMQHTAVPRTLAHVLGKALSLLQSEHQPHSSRIPLILQEKFGDHPKYDHPATADRLFSSTYPHSSQSSNCDECSPSALVTRSERSTNVPYVHYGTIASGNQVMKDSKVRDVVAQELDAVCFEMEAAGLSDICPCLSIRGVCDYSDSHKSKEWQEYAAATAAAFAREFLESLPQTEEVLASTLEQEYWLQNEKYNMCLRDLRETDPRDDKTRIQETKGGLLEDAYRWILKNEQFQEWHKASHSQLLWIKGDPGKGKTMLLCGLINELEQEHGSFLSYFFCQATEARLSNATAVLRGLIYLLVVQRPPLFSYIEEKYDHAGKKLFEDGNAWQALSKIFMTMLEDPMMDNALLIVDALDECITNQEMLLDLIVRSSRVKWIVTSRNWLEIEQWLNCSTQKVRLHLELNRESVSKAVESFIEYRLEQLAVIKRYDERLKNDVKSHLVANADGTFLWVALVCQQLADGKVLRERHTRHILKSSPKGLDPLYERMMKYISGSPDAEICKEILALASVVYRPITSTELKTLLGSHYKDKDDDLPGIIGDCGSFLTIRQDTIYFVHQSAKDFLLNKASEQILPSGLAYQHQFVFHRSLRALSETLERDICKFDHPGFNIEDIEPHCLKPLDPIRYSCVHWVDHLHDSEPIRLNNNLDKGGDVHEFFQTRYLYWLESLGLLRSIDEGINAMYKLEDLANRMKAPKAVTELLQDARRFILAHKRPIEISPLQVYVSALVFSPKHSLIRELFKDEEPDWINLKPKMDENWNNCLQTLEGHDRRVVSLSLSPDNQLIASGGLDGEVRIWDITTGLCRNILNHDGGVRSVAFLPGGQSLGAASNTMEIWNTKAEVGLRTSEGHRNNVTSPSPSFYGWNLASGSDDHTIKIWSSRTGECLKTLEGHDDNVSSVSPSLDGRYLASGSDDHTIKIWSSRTGECLKTLDGHSDEVWSVAFSPDNQRLVSGSRDGTVKVWCMELFSCLQTLEIHDGDEQEDYGVKSVVFSPDGRRLASLSKNGAMTIWDDTRTGYNPMWKAPPHGVVSRFFHGAGALAFSADGKRLAHGNLNPEIKVLDAETGANLQTLKGVGSQAMSLAFTADGQHLVSGLRVGSVKIWTTSIDIYPPAVEDHEQLVSCIAISTDGLRAISGSSDNTVKLWDTETGICLQTLEGHQGEIDSMAFSADSKRFASGSIDCTVKVWDATTGACLHTLQEDGSVCSVAFSINGQYLASCSPYGHTAKIWDAATGHCLFTFEHDGAVDLVVFSADSRYLATVSDNDEVIRIWDIVEHSFETIPGPSLRTDSIAFSVDSRYLASSSYDEKVRIWDLKQYRCVYTFDAYSRLSLLSFDLRTNSRLYTTCGPLDLEVPHPTPDVNAEALEIDTLPGSRWSGYRVTWDVITEHGKEVLWLPSEYRPGPRDVFKSTVAIGCESGRVLIMRFS